MPFHSKKLMMNTATRGTYVSTIRPMNAGIRHKYAVRSSCLACLESLRRTAFCFSFESTSENRGACLHKQDRQALA